MKREITSENIARAKSTLLQQTPKFRRPELVSGPQKAFTLAEVLITLAIIGIVAALTIPTVVRNYQERQTVTQVKKAFSTFNQALNMARVVEGPVESWGWVARSPDSAQNILIKLKPYLKMQKICGSNAGCITDFHYSANKKKKSYHNSDYFGIAVLADGMSFFIYPYNKCNEVAGTTKELAATCGQILVDINGVKPPNTYGRDAFAFYVTKYGVIPWGTKGDTTRPFDNFCNFSTDLDSDNGKSCTAWVLAKGNMDYLRKTVSW